MKYRFFFLILYALIGGASLPAAFVLRFYFDPLPFQYDEMLWELLPVAMLLKALAAEGTGLTRAVWKAASFQDIKPVAAASVLGSALFTVTALWMTNGKIPNGVLLLDGVLTPALFMACRFSGRLASEARNSFTGWTRPEMSKVLVLGSGGRTELALRFLQKRGSRVAGILDTDSRMHGRQLYGVPVLGHPESLAQVLMGRSVDEVVLALKESDPAEVMRVFGLASAAGAAVSILPEVAPAENPVHENPLRKVEMSDFLGRDPVSLDPAPLHNSLDGMRVLVTGAGGSIGSELCRQISKFPVAELVLLDFSETALFEIADEILSQEGAPPVEVSLCDIRFPDDLREVFERARPDVVYHAAACKHVPMMERHPLEAARTNVLGTRNMLQAAKAVGVKRFMHVSTDKAVNPRGIMGASKAWGEKLVREAGYSCVRFGNVLGSSGSVIPLFEKQWSRTGTLQVTHKDATRYFMTLEEAVLLILHAECLVDHGETYVLDMGEPVRILALARQMLAMKRENTGKNIEITGLRPGERLHEQLHSEEEVLMETSVPKIRRIEKRIASAGALSPSETGTALENLEQLVATRDVPAVRAWLSGIS